MVRAAALAPPLTACRWQARAKILIMPRYEYRCRACGDTFLLNRPMSESGAPATCPAGHSDTVKLLTTVGIGGLSGQGSVPAPGGCCGGACGCG